MREGRRWRSLTAKDVLGATSRTSRIFLCQRKSQQKLTSLEVHKHKLKGSASNSRGAPAMLSVGKTLYRLSVPTSKPHYPTDTKDSENGNWKTLSERILQWHHLAVFLVPGSFFTQPKSVRTFRKFHLPWSLLHFNQSIYIGPKCGGGGVCVCDPNYDLISRKLCE